jgi:hypothetical protein
MWRELYILSAEEQFLTHSVAVTRSCDTMDLTASSSSSSSATSSPFFFLP